MQSLLTVCSVMLWVDLMSSSRLFVTDADFIKDVMMSKTSLFPKVLCKGNTRSVCEIVEIGGWDELGLWQILGSDATVNAFSMNT